MIIISPETTVPEVSPVYKAISVPLWHTLFYFLCKEPAHFISSLASTAFERFAKRRPSLIRGGPSCAARSAHRARTVRARCLSARFCATYGTLRGRLPAPQMTRFIVKKFSSKSYRLDLRKILKYVKVYMYAMTVNLRQIHFARIFVTAAYLSC